MIKNKIKITIYVHYIYYKKKIHICFCSFFLWYLNKNYIDGIKNYGHTEVIIKIPFYNIMII